MLRTNKTLNKISITHQQKLLRKSEMREIDAKGRYMDKWSILTARNNKDIENLTCLTCLTV